MATQVGQQALGTQQTGTGAVSPPWPASHAVNDIALLFVQSQGGEAVTLSDPQGFAEITSLTLNNGTGVGSTRLTVFWCRATSNAMATPTVADPGDHVIARVVTYRNCVTTGNPWESLSVATAASSTAVSIPGGTTTFSSAHIVGICANAFDSATSQSSGEANADLTTVGEVTDSNTSNGSGGGFTVYRGNKGAIGAFGATTATLANASIQVVAKLILKPVSMRGTGAATKALGKTVSAAGTLKFVGTGTPTKTLGTAVSAAGALKFVGAGTPTKALSASVSAAGSLKFVGTATPTKALGATAAGVGTNTPDAPPPVTGSGSPTKALSASVSAAGSLKFVGTGAPTKTLGTAVSAAGALKFVGAGTPTKTLSALVSAAGALKFVGAGTPSKTLGTSVSAAGALKFVGSGAPTKTLGKTAAGAGAQTFGGTGAPGVTLGASAVGEGTNTADVGEVPSETPRRARGYRFLKFDLVDEPALAVPAETIDEIEQIGEPVEGFEFLTPQAVPEVRRLPDERALRRVASPTPTAPKKRTRAYHTERDEEDFLVQLFATL